MRVCLSDCNSLVSVCFESQANFNLEVISMSVILADNLAVFVSHLSPVCLQLAVKKLQDSLSMTPNGSLESLQTQGW